MAKSLSEMTLEELWELFPVFLVEHDDRWKDFYAEMEAVLREAFRSAGLSGVRLSHIGSTAVNGIMAKNIVDILAETGPDEEPEQAAEAAQRCGFLRMSSSPDRISLNFGYTPEGFADKVYHLHIRRPGDNGELYFRDYLNDHPEEAREYERLKLSLWKRFEHDRDGYTAAKTEFVESRTERARSLYGERY